jgi:hypothetical protein
MLLACIGHDMLPLQVHSVVLFVAPSVQRQRTREYSVGRVVQCNGDVVTVSDITGKQYAVYSRQVHVIYNE